MEYTQDIINNCQPNIQSLYAFAREWAQRSIESKIIYDEDTFRKLLAQQYKNVDSPTYYFGYQHLETFYTTYKQNLGRHLDEYKPCTEYRPVKETTKKEQEESL